MLGVCIFSCSLSARCPPVFREELSSQSGDRLSNCLRRALTPCSWWGWSKYGESRDNCLNICLVRSGIAHRFLRRPEIITSPPPRDGDNQGRPAPLIWTGLMTPPRPWFAPNVSIENIDTIVINVKVNNGRKITDIILITTNCHLWQYQVLLQTMEQESSKNQNPPSHSKSNQTFAVLPF